MFETELAAAAVTNPDRGDGSAFGAAMAWTFQQCEALGVGAAQAQVLVPVSTSADNDPHLQRMINVSKFSVVTVRNYRPGSGGRWPVLAVWPSLEDLAVLDIVHARVAALCIVPSGLDEMEVWVRGARPERLETPDEWPADVASLDPVVEATMESMTRTINHNNLVSGGHEKDAVVARLLGLRKEGYELDSAALQAYAIGSGWRYKNVVQLGVYLQMINAGRTPRIRSGILTEGWVQRVREQVDAAGRE